jgi:peptidoglycan/LPS O-acetylase OafA/YrhL
MDLASARRESAVAQSISIAQGEIKPLTSLRGLAARYVVIYHFRTFVGAPIDPDRWTPFFTHGSRAVDLFFILSGFILAETNPVLDNAAAYGRFLWRRMARTYPLHSFMLGALLHSN